MKNIIEDEMTNKEYLAIQKKELFFSKITAIVCCGILLIHILTGVLIVSAVFSALTSMKELNDAVSNLNSTIKPLAEIIEGLSMFSLK